MSIRLSQRTLIIIIVCASVATLILAIVLYRCLHSCRSSKRSAPLPPIQPLAHHREHQAANFTGHRGSLWYDSNDLPPVNQPYASNTGRGSKASLLAPETPLYSSRHPSSSDEGTDELSAHSALDHNGPFRIPNSSFTSVNSMDEFGAPVRPRTRSTSFSRNPSGFRHSRPPSVAGRNTIRGTPHGPHSQVQIILPPPLGSDPATFMSNGEGSSSRPASRFDVDAGDRLSVVDRWLPSASRSTTSTAGSRPLSMGESRTSMSSLSNGSHRSAGPRSLRQSPSGSNLPSQNPPSSEGPPEDTPPVPRIPSMYNVYTPDDTELSTYSSEPGKSMAALPQGAATPSIPQAGLIMSDPSLGGGQLAVPQ